MSLLRSLPSVDKLKKYAILRDFPPHLQSIIARNALEQVRAQALDGRLTTVEQVERAVEHKLHIDAAAAAGPRLRRILNGSGVLLHTNAGRSPLPQAALDAIADTSRGYCNLEFSLENGQRTSRHDHLRPLLQWLTGAEDALVVNNGAAAILLALHGLALGQRVVVSRGELVEIGGGFRIPEIMAAAGCELIEVGTTNRTHLRDYAKALAKPAKDRAVAAVLQVHRSNFAQIGFVATPPLADLAQLAQAHHLPLIVDLGSGALGELPISTREPTVQQVLAAGADLVTFSGDKWLGGPQAGIIVGKRAFIRKLAEKPLARALRVDNTILAALEVVLRLHLLGGADTELPVISAVHLSLAAVDHAARTIADALQARLDPDWRVEIMDHTTQLGGGTDPLAELPSRALAIVHHKIDADTIKLQLLGGFLPVLCRVRAGFILLDVRSLLAGHHKRPIEELSTELASCLLAACTSFDAAAAV